ncbi:MAG: hypothetical protein ACFFAV_07115 [Candidatus Hermodarchaeota archaeon]
MEWRVKYIFNFPEDITWHNGYAHFGFHDYKGNFYVLRHEQHWFGEFNKNNEFLWTAGSKNPNLCDTHMFFDLKKPTFVSRSPTDDTLIIASKGNKRIYKLLPDEKKFELFIDMEEVGANDIGNCVFDKEGNVWINEVTGCKIWQFDSHGKKKNVLGDGKPGFQLDTVSFNDAQFNWIYDLRIGPDNYVYVLDSGNYTVRMIDISEETVELIVGTGEPGYLGDGKDAKKATLGSDKNEQFDGPWAMALDEDGVIFIGDTHNHVVRMVEKKKKKRIISTILGNTEYTPSLRNSVDETDPFKINLPKICSMDYYNKELFIPDYNGDLIVFEKLD